MGKIQQQIKQDLNVAGALYTQTASYQQKQAEKAVKYEQKSLEKQRENIEQSSIKPEIKQQLLDENLKAQVQAGKNPVSPASPEKIAELRELNEARKSRLAEEKQKILKEKEAQSFEEEIRDRDIQAQETADYFDRQQELYGDVKDDKKADMSQKVASVSEKSQHSQRSRVQNKLKNLKSTGSREQKKDIKYTRI